MKSVLIVLAFVVCACSATKWHELESTGYDFARYLQEHKKSYSSVQEHTARKAIFDKNLAAIKEHNMKSLSWKNGVNQFTDRTPAELKALRGHRRDISHMMRAKNTASKHKLTGLPVPDFVDWRKTGAISAIKDQGQCGSCWTFAAASSMESQWFLKTGQITDLSEQQIASCTENPRQCGGTGGCEGGTAEVAFASVITNGGIASEWTYPYQSYMGSDFKCNFPGNKTQNAIVKLTSYNTISSNNYTEFIDAVANVGPVAISVDASSWSAYESGIYDGCDQKAPTIDHAVQVVGYGTENNTPYWIVRNSWAPTWGENGYIRLLRDVQPRCGTDPDPSQGSGCSGGPTTVTVCGTCGILYDNCYPVIAN